MTKKSHEQKQNFNKKKVKLKMCKLKKYTHF